MSTNARPVNAYFSVVICFLHGHSVRMRQHYGCSDNMFCRYANACNACGSLECLGRADQTHQQNMQYFHKLYYTICFAFVRSCDEQPWRQYQISFGPERFTAAAAVPLSAGYHFFRIFGTARCAHLRHARVQVHTFAVRCFVIMVFVQLWCCVLSYRIFLLLRGVGLY